MAKEKLPVTTSAQMAHMFFVLLAVNSFVLWLANAFFPKMIVLGNAMLDRNWAILLSMGMLSLIGMLCVPVFEYYQEQKGRALSTTDWMVGYLVINFVAIWGITRFAEEFGMGISAWWIALILAAVMDFLQGIGMMLVYKK